VRQVIYRAKGRIGLPITKEIAAKINALLEIGLEEVPARFMTALLADLKEKAEKELQSARLPFKSVQTFGTYRRLVLYIEGLPAKQEDISKEVKGPSREQAFGGNGTPTKAAEGFAASQSVMISDLKIKKVGEKEFVFASVTEKGVETDRILEQMLPKVIKSLYLPISMRWGSTDLKFIRPVHWIFAACGSKVINFSIADIKASNKTYGHRSLGNKPIIINISKGIDIKNFTAALLKAKVMLDQDERREKISSMIKSSAKKLGAVPLLDKDLLEEVNYLCEWPVALSGRFDREFLKLPKDVLITSMKKNQKYFSAVDSAEKLMPVFVNIADGTKAEDIKAVAEGNERVLVARLNDAKFFFDEDRKNLLAENVPKLTKVAFYEKLGSMYEKVERISALSAWIAKELRLPDAKKNNIKEIAALCKADLLSQMVYEFPSLQGVMGREYSLIEGKPKEIAAGIFEHYLPRHAEDELPSSIEGAVVGLADKIDSIVGCFSIDLIPSGSEDPYGLRRQAHGIVSILLGRKTGLALDELVEKAYKLYEPLFLGEVFTAGKVKYNEVSKVIPGVLSFIAARLKGIMLEEGISYDVADAVLAGFEDVLDAHEKAKAVSKSLKEEWLKGIVFTADRITRLAVNANRDNVIETDFVSEDERSLYALFLDVNNSVNELLERSDYEKALRELARMTKPVDDFFIKVMVMDKNEKLRANRLALLKTLERMYLEIGDLSKIVM
jgi:glycyl-tRNA synthetase beta chain